MTPTDTVDKLAFTYAYALQQMNVHGLLAQNPPWIFKFDNPINRVGQCNDQTKVISFSKNFLHIPQSEIMDTILHEIAHALVGPGNGYNLIWRKCATEIGAKPAPCAEVGVATAARPKYVIKCPIDQCNQKWYRYRLKPRRNAQRAPFGFCPTHREPLQAYKLVYKG